MSRHTSKKQPKTRRHRVSVVLAEEAEIKYDGHYVCRVVKKEEMEVMLKERGISGPSFDLCSSDHKVSGGVEKSVCMPQGCSSVLLYHTARSPCVMEASFDLAVRSCRSMW